MVRRKLNVRRLLIFIISVIFIFILIILGIKSLIDEKKYKETYEYKLSNIGYSTNEIDYITDKYSNKEIDSLLKMKYNSNIVKLMKEKYFIYNNLNKYLDNMLEDITLTISKVNSHAYLDWYEEINDTDTSLGILMLVNKFNKLSTDYTPELVDVSLTYAYNGKQVSKLIYDDLTSMLDNARTLGYKLVVSQGYRSYNNQLDAYNSIESTSGAKYADKVAARPGHSEYQTGLSVTVKPYNTEIEDVTNNPEHIWLEENSYKYGFIIRYPEGKEDITGFQYEPWRLRYVGTEAASIIHEDNITFDEYYEYYIVNGGK